MAKKTKRMSVLEKVVAKVRETGEPYMGHNLTLKYKAWVSGNVIKVREYANDCDEEMLRCELEFEL